MAFRKRRPPVTQPAAQFQFPTNGHLKTSITATFPDGSQFEFFVIPEWQNKPGLPVMGDVIQYLPQPGDKNVVLQNAAHDYLRFAFGEVDGFTSEDGELEIPAIAMVSSYQEVADEHGIDLFDWTVNKCQWSPNIFRDPRKGSRRIRDAFGVEEEVIASVHGVLRAGLWQSTYHLTNRALYIFGESHEQSKARIPLELYMSSTLNPQGAFGRGNFQAIFLNPDNFDFGELPENAVRGQVTFDASAESVDVLAIAGFQIAERNKFRDFQQEMAYALRTVLPTKRISVHAEGRTVELDISKTISTGGHFVFVDRDLSERVASQITKSEEFKRVVKETLATLDKPSVPNDVSQFPNQVPAAGSENDEPKKSEPGDLVSRLARIDEMHQEGIISDVEHKVQRQRLLDEI